MNDDLRQGGAKVAAGEFRLDEARAREKLAQFQLVDPRRYVLEFVKAAHLLGATGIEFQMDTDELEVRFDGDLVSREEFDDLASAVFGRRATAKQRALRHLAIGQNAAQTLRLREFSFEVLEGEPRPVMRIYLREQVRAAHLFLFARSLLSNRLPEAEILRAHCALATLPIFVNGERISTGPTFTGEQAASVEIADPVGRGKAWLNPRHGEGGIVHIETLYHGVLVGRHTMNSPLGDAHVIFESSGLTLNLSQSEVVQDDFWSDVLVRIIPNALLKCLVTYFEQMPHEDAARHRRKILELIISVVNLFPVETSRPEPIGRTFDAFIEVASGLAIFEIANPSVEERQQGVLVSIRDLSWTNAETGKTRFYIARRTFPGVELQDRARVLLYTPTARHEGHAFMPFAQEVFDATDLLEQEQQRLENQRKWKSWKGLDGEVFSRRLEAQAEGIEVIVALSPDQAPSKWARSHIVSGDAVIAEVTWPTALIGGLVLVISGPLELNAALDGPAITDSYRRAVATLCVLIPALCLSSKSWGSVEEQQAFIRASFDPRAAQSLEALLHYHEKDGLIGAALGRGVLRALTHQLEQWTSEQISAEREALHRLLGETLRAVQGQDSAKAPENVASVDAFLDAVAKLPIFEIANPTDGSEQGVYFSLDAIRWTPPGSDRSRLYISSQRFNASQGAEIKLRDGGRVLLHGPEWGKGGTLLRLFVDDLYDARPLLSARFMAAANRKRWAERPAWSNTEFESIHIQRFEAMAGPLKVSVGVRLRGDDRQAIIFVKEGRLLSESSALIGLLPGFTILIEGDLAANANFNGPAMTEDYRGAVNATVELLGRVVLRQVEELRGQHGSRRALLNQVFADKATGQVHDALRVDKETLEGLDRLGDGFVRAAAQRVREHMARGIEEHVWMVRQLIFDVIVGLGLNTRNPPMNRLAREFLDLVVTLPLFTLSNPALTERGSAEQRLHSIEELRWLQTESGRTQLCISSRHFPGVTLGPGRPVLFFDTSLGEDGGMFLCFADDVFDSTQILAKRANPLPAPQPSVAAPSAALDDGLAAHDVEEESRFSALLLRQLGRAGVLTRDFEIVYQAVDDGSFCLVKGERIELNRTHPALVHGLGAGDEVATAFVTSMVISHLVFSQKPWAMESEADTMRVGLIAHLSGVLDEQ